PRELMGPLAAQPDGGEGRRYLHRPGALGCDSLFQERARRGESRERLADVIGHGEARDLASLAVERIGLDTQPDGRLVGFVVCGEPGDELGGLAYGND